MNKTIAHKTNLFSHYRFIKSIDVALISFRTNPLTLKFSTFRITVVFDSASIDRICSALLVLL